MIKHMGLLFALYVAAVLETRPGGLGASADVRLCLPALVVCCAAWSCTPFQAMFWGAAAGLVADALTNGPLGLEMSIAAAVAWAASRVRMRHEWKSTLHFCVLCVLVLAAETSTAAFSRWALAGGVPGFETLLISAGSSTLATALLGLSLFVVGRGVRGAFAAPPRH